MTAFRDQLGAGLTGLALGFALSRIGFSSWDEVHAMFTFAELRLTLAFAFGVTLLGLIWLVFARRGARWPAREIHRGTLAGGALFGAGWAISGACPAITLVQIGEGQLGAIVTLAGIFAGNWAYGVVHGRWLRWPTNSCNDG